MEMSTGVFAKNHPVSLNWSDYMSIETERGTNLRFLLSIRMFSDRVGSRNDRNGVAGGWRSKNDCRLSRHLLTFYRVFQSTISSELKFPRREGGPSF